MLHTVIVTPEQSEHGRIVSLLPTIFPPEELLPKNKIEAPRPYLCFYEDDSLIGFAEVLRHPQLHYLKYMAILEEFRSKGYGGQMLELILAERGKVPLALDIEPLDKKAQNYEQRVRRFNFYTRHGLIDTGYMFQVGNNAYTIMSTGEETVLEVMRKYCRECTLFNPGYLQIINRLD